MNSTILYNEQLARGFYRMGLEWKTPEVVPGQFIMLRVSDGLDPLLRRPFGIYNVLGAGPDTVVGEPSPVLEGTGIDIVYQVVGRGTDIMSRKAPGEPVDVLGPLGNGFPRPADPSRAVLVGGGMGVVPLHLFARTLPGATLLFGTRGKAEAVLVRDFEKGLPLKRLAVATEDGSMGEKGLVTDLLSTELSSDSVVYSCGPPAMLKAVAAQASGAGARCYVSLEKSMACGIGVCLGCAVKTGHAGGDDREYRMVCSDGPVFDSAAIDWERF